MSSIALRGGCTAVLLLAALAASAADPASGTLDTATPELTWTTGPMPIANVSGAIGDTYTCDGTNPCDIFTLTVDLPANFPQTHPLHRIRVSGAASPEYADVDLQLANENGELIDYMRDNPPDQPSIVFAPVGGRTVYQVQIVPGTPIPDATGMAVLFQDEPPPPSEPPPGAPVATGLPPRFQTHVPPKALGNESAEPTIGYNPHSKRAMFIDYVNALRLTFGENAEPPQPAACDALWEDKSGVITKLNTLDPLIYTDPVTGRTFNSQLSGYNSLFEYSDDDGETWTPGQIGPPNGGADHQGIISGPYPAGFPVPQAGLLYPNAIYYCSQSVAAGFCSRSDDGGQTFGPGMPFKNPDCSAGALHGHPKVGPDGTLYVPDSSQCVLPIGPTAENVLTFVSEDAGTTFEARPVPGSIGGAGSDPSIGVATDGTVYMCYENGDSRARMAVSKDKGVTWINDIDIGAADGIVASRFPSASAGDPDRASCAFLGTRTEGNSASLDFEGVWYPYIATTYDGGQSYHLVNVSPDDPAQGWGGVGPSGTNRNLLDFNDMEIDEQGRILFAWADGCVEGCVLDPRANSFAAKGTVVRQTGGRTLLSAFDDEERFNTSTPLAPAQACASAEKSIRSPARTQVAWNAPDSGGGAITSYRVLRSDAADGSFTEVGTTPSTRFLDNSADPAVGTYYYKVIAEGANGTAPESNVIALPMGVEPFIDTCTLPGDIIAPDGVGDSPAPDTDFEFLAVAEPEEYEGNFVFTLKVVEFTGGVPPPTSFYPVLFPLRDGLFVAMDNSQALPRYVYGVTEELPQGLLAFTEQGTLDERSTYLADGTIMLVVPKSLFGDPAVGTIISGFDARARVGSASASSRDTTGPGHYTVRGTAVCNVSGLILGILGASTQTGAAPLTVDFTVSGQPTDGATLQSWTLEFGDGEKLENQSFAAGQSSATVSHTYRAAGNYPARLTVTDSAGQASTNRAERVIQVTAGSGAPAAIEDAGRFGSGALPGVALLVLLLAAGLRRRQR